MAVFHLEMAPRQQTHTFLLDSEHLPPDFTVKIRNSRRVPSNKDQIKYISRYHKPQQDYFKYFTVMAGHRLFD
jgi:hypothetical protein